MKTVETSKPVTFFFDDKETCMRACDTLGVSKRKCTNLDRTLMGYSKKTGHYGMRTTRMGVLKVPLHFKLTVTEDDLVNCFSRNSDIEVGQLDDTLGWIVE